MLCLDFFAQLNTEIFMSGLPQQKGWTLRAQPSDVSLQRPTNPSLHNPITIVFLYNLTFTLKYPIYYPSTVSMTLLHIQLLPHVTEYSGQTTERAYSLVCSVELGHCSGLAKHNRSLMQEPSLLKMYTHPTHFGLNV